VLVATVPWKVALSWRSLRRGLEANFQGGVMVNVSMVIKEGSFL
jgi:hypothetical protein